MPTKYRNSVYMYILSLIPVLIVTPPRLGCGLIMIVLLNLIMILGTTIRFFMNKIDTGNTDRVVLLSFLIFFTIIYKRLIMLFSPILAMLLSFALFFIPISPICLDLLFKNDNYSSPKVFGTNMLSSGIFSLHMFLFFIFREILAYGSISIPVKSGIKALVFIPVSSSFWATLPGTFVLLALILAIIIFVDQKLDVIRRTK